MICVSTKWLFIVVHFSNKLAKQAGFSSILIFPMGCIGVNWFSNTENFVIKRRLVFYLLKNLKIEELSICYKNW
jgi:hypothetical protein